MANTKRQLKALAALNLDLFEPQPMSKPAPATLWGKIKEHARRPVSDQSAVASLFPIDEEGLPSLEELYRRFERYNWMYFKGKLTSVRIEFSSRMTSAGSYTPGERVIKIGRKYHRLFPDDIDDTLKHEMIHILHFRHNAAFKAEARRIGASVRAKSHPELRRPPRYTYGCPACGREYPRQKRLRMASCGYCSRNGRFDSRFKLRLISSRNSQKG